MKEINKKIKQLESKLKKLYEEKASLSQKKRFKVSLAIVREVNFEIEVEAINRLEAAKLAAHKFDFEREEGEIIEDDCDHFRPSFYIDDDGETGGIEIEEIEDEDDDAASGEQHCQD